MIPKNWLKYGVENNEISSDMILNCNDNN